MSVDTNPAGFALGTRSAAETHAEFMRITVVALGRDEPWAQAYVDTYAAPFPRVPALVAQARLRGTSPIGAVQAFYGMPPETAAELIELLQARGALG